MKNSLRFFWVHYSVEFHFGKFCYSEKALFNLVVWRWWHIFSIASFLCHFPFHSIQISFRPKFNWNTHTSHIYNVFFVCEFVTGFRFGHFPICCEYHSHIAIVVIIIIISNLKCRAKKM